MKIKVTKMELEVGEGKSPNSKGINWITVVGIIVTIVGILLNILGLY